MKHIVFISLVLLFTPVLHAENFKTGRLTSSDGLSNSAIMVIHKDSSQVMWFGTWDGLNAFDGRNVDVYKPRLNDTNSIDNNIIIDITEPSAGILWIATTTGLNRIDTHTGKIDRYRTDRRGTALRSAFAYRMALDNHNNLFVYSYGKNLNYFDPSKNSFVPLSHPLCDKLNVNNLEGDSDGNLLLLTRTGEFIRINVTSDDNGTMYIENCQRILNEYRFVLLSPKSKDDFWLIDSNDNLYLYNSVSGNLRLIGNITIPTSHGSINAICEYNNDIIIAHSYAGLYRYRISDKRLEQMPGDEFRGGIMSLFYDENQQILWVGTNNVSGAVYLYQDNLIFKSLLNEEIREFRRSPIRSIAEDSRGRIWIGSRGDGISIVSDIHNPDKCSIQHVPDLQRIAVLSMASVSGESMFVGTEIGSLYVCNEKDLSVRRVNLDRVVSGRLFPPIYSIYWDENSSVLWIGTNTSGILKCKLRHEGNNYNVTDWEWYSHNPDNPQSLSHNNVFSIVPQDSTHLWVATRGGGLNLMDIDKGIFTSYKNENGTGIADNDVLCLTKAENGAIWAGTSNGFSRVFLRQDGQVEIKNYTEQSGLQNNSVHGILEDDSGIIWISTNKGISKMNPTNDRIFNYANGYGLQSNEFSDGAYCRSSNGELFFGGINGLNHFYPSEFRERMFNPDILICDFKLNNVSLPVSEYIKGEGTDREIHLEHNQNFFSVGFVALDYINNANCEYRYILEGFNADWVNIGTNNYAVFTNVPPGNYTLRVQSTNGDKVWSENTLDIPLIIAKPWWATWWAYLIYCAVLAWITYVIYNIISKRTQLNHAIFRERLEKKQQHHLYEAKLRFFTNIAHEFCTPLTLIYGPCEKLLDSEDITDESRRYVWIIKSNAERMQRLINDLMDFHRVESDTREPVYEKIDVYELLRYISENFVEFAEQRRIDFSTEFELKEHICVTDRDALEKILFNLISNAYKYTNEEGKIRVRIDEVEREMHISVYNTGKGIKPHELEGVFNRFQILDNFEKHASKGIIQRTGIGLALTKSLVEHLGGKITVSSVENEFAEFEVWLPINHEITIIKSESVDSEIPKPIQIFEEGSQPLVLVVDDEVEIRDLLRDILSPYYRVMEARDGAEAMEMMKLKRPTIIISDILMPNINGVQLLEEVKNNKLTSHIPIIFLSSKAAIEDQISNYQRGLEFFIAKPFNPKYLLSVVGQIYQNRNSLKDYYNSSLQNIEEFNGNVIHSDDREFLRKVVEIIEQNLSNEDLNPEFICNEMAISRIQFYRKIKAASNLSTSEFIRGVKLNHAAKMIRTTTLTIQEIMYRTGFNNKSYFYTVFKKEFGVSPKEYRK